MKNALKEIAYPPVKEPNHTKAPSAPDTEHRKRTVGSEFSSLVHNKAWELCSIT